MLHSIDEVEAIIGATADGTVELDGATTPYQLDVVEEIFERSQTSEYASTIKTSRAILIATGKLPGLQVGSFPILEGQRWRVRDLRLENDGQETRVLLALIGEPGA